MINQFSNAGNNRKRWLSKIHDKHSSSESVFSYSWINICNGSFLRLRGISRSVSRARRRSLLHSPERWSALAESLHFAMLFSSTFRFLRGQKARLLLFVIQTKIYTSIMSWVPFTACSVPFKIARNNADSIDGAYFLYLKVCNADVNNFFGLIEPTVTRLIVYTVKRKDTYNIKVQLIFSWYQLTDPNSHSLQYLLPFLNNRSRHSSRIVIHTIVLSYTTVRL